MGLVRIFILIQKQQDWICKKGIMNIKITLSYPEEQSKQVIQNTAYNRASTKTYFI